MLLCPIGRRDPQEWDRLIAINLKAFYTTLAALQHLLVSCAEGPRPGLRYRQQSLDRRPRLLEQLAFTTSAKFGVTITESLRQESPRQRARRCRRTRAPPPPSLPTGSHNNPMSAPI